MLTWTSCTRTRTSTIYYPYPPPPAAHEIIFSSTMKCWHGKKLKTTACEAHAAVSHILSHNEDRCYLKRTSFDTKCRV